MFVINKEGARNSEDQKMAMRRTHIKKSIKHK
jgi:hypothetical protein